MGIIRVEDIRCYAYHGCMDEEGMIGTDYSVYVEVNTDLAVSSKTDKLADTIDYVAISRIVQEQMAIRSRQRMDRLRNISMKLRTPSGLTDLENQPAYKRREVQLDNISHSSESDVSKYTLGKDSDDNPLIKPNNFLHDNVD